MQHRVKHVPWYDFWFNNCQRCAIRHVAEPILCRNCYSSESQSAKDNFSSLKNLSVTRHLDRLFTLNCLTYKLFQWHEGHEANLKDMSIRHEDTRKNLKLYMLAWAICTSFTIYFVKINHNVFRKIQNELHRKFGRLQEFLKYITLREGKPSIGFQHYGLVALLMWELLDGQISLLRFVSSVWIMMRLTNLDICLISSEIPPEMRGAVDGQCDECSDLFSVVHTQYKRCQHLWLSAAMFTNNRHRRVTFKSLVSPPREDQAYLFVRWSAAIFIVFMQSYHPATDSLNLHLGIQVLLNHFAPVTNWGHGMRSFWNHFWFSYLFCQHNFGAEHTIMIVCICVFLCLNN